MYRLGNFDKNILVNNNSISNIKNRAKNISERPLIILDAPRISNDFYTNILT